ncbi:hemerythrin domain-containing protein [Catenulispora subtropica]|uniref:Hemerythrin-like domain-containing protein n=1 Tax=Catenulispora subtropica TaxID=450798 RepID=A0ABP5DSC0_9ACTN
MCFYCGCREIPLIADLIAEHEDVTDLGAALTAALGAGDLDRARHLVREVAEKLRSHWLGEETGLFDVMRADEGYREYIDALVREHRELRDLLAGADLEQPADRARVVEAMEELYHHIAKEEDGLFPASLTALSGEQWDRAMRAWAAAHPRVG